MRKRPSKTQEPAIPVFKNTLTVAEYAAALERAKYRTCPTCENEFLRDQGHQGPRQDRGALYCSLRCKTDAEIKTALLDRRSPAGGLTIDGWDL